MTDTVSDHVEAADRMRRLIEKLADCTDPREASSLDDELEAFAWFIREAREILDEGVKPKVEEPGPIKITPGMVAEAMHIAGTRNYKLMRRELDKQANDWAGTPDVTPSAIVGFAVASFIGSRQAEAKRRGWK